MSDGGYLKFNLFHCQLNVDLPPVRIGQWYPYGKKSSKFFFVYLISMKDYDQVIKWSEEQSLNYRFLERFGKDSISIMIFDDLNDELIFRLRWI